MKDLSFGEQVKIILKRKGMTIKELAETIEERTGKVMSRQNLTQRLNRDNFQEQDMRLIAAILECPFYLSLFPIEMMEDTQIIPAEDVISRYADKAQARKRGGDTAVVETVKSKLGRTTGRQAYSSGSIAGDEKLAAAEDLQLSDSEKADVAKALEIMEGESENVSEGRELTIGEVYGMYERLDEMATPFGEEYLKESKETFRRLTRGSDEEAKDSYTVSEGVGKTNLLNTGRVSAEASNTGEIGVGTSRAQVSGTQGDLDETVERVDSGHVQKSEEKKDVFRTGTVFLRRPDGQEKTQTRRFVKISDEDEGHKTERRPFSTTGRMQSIGGVRRPRETSPMNVRDFEPVIPFTDQEEDLELGELNPYTGHEYQSNSVRMHPTRIGYVQVYERSVHGWTDMTEWAFLGHQERLKAKLGKNYKEPIYLD